ncbi:MAG: hypothetical protein IPJ31_00565 [Bacteroidetes bacterium]|nr:hypothetical protein [Bacteroidota bacterium]
MQTDENELDRYLKGKVEEAHFEFKEIYWEKALEMLDAEDERKKRPGIWRWFTLIGTLIVLSVGAIFITQNKSNSQEKTKKTSFVSEENNNAENANKPSYTVDPSNNTTNSIAENNNQEVSEINSSDQLAPTQTNPTNSPSSQSEKTAGTSQAPKNDRISNPKDFKPTASQEFPAAPNPAPAGSLPSKIEPKRINKKSGKALAHPVADIKTEGQSNINTPAPSANKTVMLNGQRMQPIDTQVLIQKQAQDERIYNPRYFANLSNYVTERIDSITILTFKPANDTKQETPLKEAAKMESASDSSKKTNKLKIFVAAGANFNKGFAGNQSTTVAWGIAPYLNVGIEKTIRNKISMSAHIGFTYFNGLNLEKTAVNYKYSFGFDSTKISVQYNRMYQLLLPISVAYQIGKLHTVIGGIGGSYVCNTESLVTENKSSKNQKGYLDGINRFDIFSMLGYQFQIHNKLGAQLLWQQGFMNAAQKEFFSIQSNNTQTRMSLGLKYYFKRNGN